MFARLRVDSADTRADGTALSQQAEKHHLEAQKKRESRKLPSQAEKRREKRRWFDKILAQRKTWEIHGGPTTKRGHAFQEKDMEKGNAKGKGWTGKNAVDSRGVPQTAAGRGKARSNGGARGSRARDTPRVTGTVFSHGTD